MTLSVDSLLPKDRRSGVESVGQAAVDLLPKVDNEAVIEISRQEGLTGIGAENGMWGIVKSVELPKDKLHQYLRDLSGKLELGAAVKYSHINFQDELQMEIRKRGRMRVRYVFPGRAQKEAVDDWQFVDVSHTSDRDSMHHHIEEYGLPSLMLDRPRNWNDYMKMMLDERVKQISEWEAIDEPPTVIMVMQDMAASPKDVKLINDLAHDPGVGVYIEVQYHEKDDENVRLDLRLRMGHTAYDKGGIQNVLNEVGDTYQVKELEPPVRASEKIRRIRSKGVDLSTLKLQVRKDRYNMASGKRNAWLAQYAEARVAALERAGFGDEAVGFREFAEMTGVFNFLHYMDIPELHESTVKTIIGQLNTELSRKGMEKLTELTFVAMASELLAMGSPAIMVSPDQGRRIEMVPTGTAAFRDYVELIKKMIELMPIYPSSSVDERFDVLRDLDWRRSLYNNASEIYKHLAALRTGIREGKKGEGAITVAALKLGRLRSIVTDTVGYYLAQATGALLNVHHQISWNAADVGNQSFETGLSAGVYTATQRDGKELGWKADMRGIDVFFVLANYMATNSVESFTKYLEDNSGIRVTKGSKTGIIKLDSAKKLWQDYLGSLHRSENYVEGLRVPEEFWRKYVDATEGMASYFDMREAADGYLLAATRWLQTEADEDTRERLVRVFPEMMYRLSGWRLASMQYYSVLSMMGLYSYFERSSNLDTLRQDGRGDFEDPVMRNGQAVARYWHSELSANHAEMVRMMVGAPTAEAMSLRGGVQHLG